MTQRRPTGEVTGIRRAVNMIPAPPVVFELFFPTSAKISAPWRRPVLSSDPKAARMISRNPVAGGLRHGRLALDVWQPQHVEYPDRTLDLLVVQRQNQAPGSGPLAGARTSQGKRRTTDRSGVACSSRYPGRASGPFGRPLPSCPVSPASAEAAAAGPGRASRSRDRTPSWRRRCRPGPPHRPSSSGRPRGPGGPPRGCAAQQNNACAMWRR